MYSKDKGLTRPGSPSATGDYGGYPPRRRSHPERVLVPPNYSGHAIVDGEERPLGSLAPTETVPPSAADVPAPRFDHLPRVSDLGEPARRSPRTLPVSFEVAEDAPLAEDDAERLAGERLAGERLAGERPETSSAPTDAPPPSVPSRPAHSLTLFDAARFPFGHGIGFEELFLLGLILLLLRESGDCEDRGDLNETVLLLGLLLLME